MTTTLSPLTPADYDAVDALMKRHSKTLGFLARKVLQQFLHPDGSDRGIAAKDEDGNLIGYILYAAYPDYIRVAHLCVSIASQKRGIAKNLVNKLLETVTTQKDVRLNCRRDFPAHKIWPKLGFVPLDEKPGRSQAGHPLTFWRLPLAKDDRFDLFRARTSDDTIDAVIDAQVLFDVHAPDDDTTIPSKALLADFLADSLTLFLTDEIFVEVDRNRARARRLLSRQRARGFPLATYDPQLRLRYADALTAVLPRRTPSQQSDIQQLAKAAAARIPIFVTRDENLLKKAPTLSKLTGLQILRPTELILRLHELHETHSYVPRRVAGRHLEWRRLASSELSLLPLATFRRHREKESALRNRFGSFVAAPNSFTFEVLWLDDQAVAVRIIEEGPGNSLAVPLCRTARSVDQFLFARFLVADTIAKAVESNHDTVAFRKATVDPLLLPHLLDLGFLEYADQFLRYCFSHSLNHDEALSKMTLLSPDSQTILDNRTSLELEAHSSPCHIRNTDQGYFLVPIRPSYAMSLFDVAQSAGDLFGGRTSVLLRWQNVYYRANTLYRMLVPPARILWYVSQRQKSIVAVSRLDKIEIGPPKVLFKKFKNLGIFEWRDLYEMCRGDADKEIMALVFSHTFSFRRPVPLEVVKQVFAEDGIGMSLQSPRRIPASTFARIYQWGFPKC